MSRPKGFIIYFSVSKKKKKNRFGGLSRNKTAPSPYDDDGTDSDHRDPRDYRSRDMREPTGGARGNPIALGWKDDPLAPGSRGFRASRSPRLEPLEEPEYELESHCKYIYSRSIVSREIIYLLKGPHHNFTMFFLT